MKNVNLASPTFLSKNAGLSFFFFLTSQLQLEFIKQTWYLEVWVVVFDIKNTEVKYFNSSAKEKKT